MTEEEKEFIRSIDPSYDWYRCTSCNSISLAPAGNFNLTVASRKGRCLDCINERDKSRAKEIRKKHQKIYQLCEICGGGFMTINGKTCSQECRTKLTEKNRFYKDLKKANKEVDASKVHVYGQGNFAVSVFDKKVVAGLKKDLK